MPTQSFSLLFDIAMLLFFLLGTVWTWGWVRFPGKTQDVLEQVFSKSRNRFKWLFLVGLLILIAARIVRMTAG
jgi:hypothetical protein